MKEFPLTEAFIKVIEGTAVRSGAKKINRIWLTAGRGMYFRRNTTAYLECILKGTAADGAEIFIEYGNEAQKCRRCGLVFPKDKTAPCPMCGGEGSRISLDHSFIIDRMEIER